MAQELSGPDWRRQAVLDGKAHNYTGVSPWMDFPEDVMELVVHGRATREQLWALEGRIFRYMITGRTYRDIYRYSLLWACVYRARRGFQVEYYYFWYLSQAVNWRKLSVDEQSLKEMADGLYPRERLYAWSWFIGRVAIARGSWKDLPDVLTGIVPGDSGVLVEEQRERAVSLNVSKNTPLVRSLVSRWLNIESASAIDVHAFYFDWEEADVMVRLHVRQALIRKQEYSKAHRLPG